MRLSSYPQLSLKPVVVCLLMTQSHVLIGLDSKLWTLNFKGMSGHSMDYTKIATVNVATVSLQLLFGLNE